MAHRNNVHLPKFEEWLRDKLQDVEYSDSDVVKRAVDLCIDDNEVDFRDVTSHEVARQLMSSYLPLPSNTQFVERGVKEAKNVSTTGQQEEQRSACAALRSFNVLCVDFDRTTNAPDRVKYLIANADQSIFRKTQAMAKMGGEEPCAKAHKEARKLVHEEHYKYKRLQGLIEQAIEAAERNKVRNVSQKRSGAGVTIAQMGWIAYKALYKDYHLDFLVSELEMRSHDEFCYAEDHPKSGKQKTFTDLKNAMKSLEKTRLESEEAEIVALTEKGFESISEEAFVPKPE